MKKRSFKRTVGMLLAITMLSCNEFPYNAFANEGVESFVLGENTISLVESKGWHESAYVKWTPLNNAESYNVYYKKSNEDSYTKIDTQLIRKYPDYYVADAVGLEAGSYVIKVAPVINGIEFMDLATETNELVVDNYVREGFAFSSNSPYSYTTGAYNKNGTLKDNADVIYVTDDNKDSVTVNGDEGLGVGLTDILSKREKSKSEKPLAIRILGKVKMPKDTSNYMVAIRNTKNITVEGIGDDATVHGYGFTTKRACNLEFRNFAIMWYGGGGDGDSLSLDTDNKNIWIHNIDFFYGYGKEADQAKGDGSVDLKAKTDYVTVSYCHFWDSGKALVAGGPWEVSNYTKPEAKINVTYHHNWFDHSDSRHPRCVAGNTHVYNNYYDGVAKYGVGAAVNASVFVENNYFRNCPRPMLIATQGSDVYDNGVYKIKGTLSGQAGGMIKEWGNTIIGAKRFFTYQTTPDEGHFDAYTVESKNDRVPNTVTALSGGAVYNNFDTDLNVMYEYSADTPEQAKDKVISQAGRRNGGDFKFTFDNSVQDKNSDVIPELQQAIINYNSELVAVQGILSSVEVTTEKITEETTEITTETSTETTTETTKQDFMFGDADNSGSLTGYDASLVLQKVLKGSFVLPIETLTDDYMRYIDVNMDGELTSADVAIITQKILKSNFVMPVEATTETTTFETTTESTTEVTTLDTTTESTTGKMTEVTTGETTESTTESTTENTVSALNWNADMEIPEWLNLANGTIGGTSSSHSVFQNVDSTIASQKNRYTIPKKSTITINLSFAATITVYMAGNNNGDGKGTISADLNDSNIGTYTLPGRQNKDAQPFVITATRGGLLKLTNTYDGLLYKIVISGSTGGSVQPVEEKYDVKLSLNNNTDLSTEVIVGKSIISVSSNEKKEAVLTLKQGKHSVSTSNTRVRLDKNEINVTGDDTFELNINKITENVVVLNKAGGYVNGFETISEALTSPDTVDGSIISINPGYYNETFEVSKSVTLKKADDTEGEVIIYSSNGSYGGSMKGIVRVTGTNVIFKDLTLLNNTNASYKDIKGLSTGGTTAAALIADGDNSIYNNCKFISVQDTVNTAHYSKGKPLLKQTYNNCIFYGATDFICGSCDIDFNNCQFRIFTGTLTSKKDAYVFAPNVEAIWTVNGGSLVNDENSVVENFFYARAWESNSSNSQTLDIFGMENQLKMGKKGIMGFGSSTGGGATHSINDFQFNVYEGADKSSDLIATSNITKVDIFELSEASVIEFDNNNSANLIVGNFGKSLNQKFIDNVLQDIVEIGFVSDKNASETAISDKNTIKIKNVYKSLTQDTTSKYAFSNMLEATEGYLGCGVLSGIDTNKSVTLVPYVKYDPITDSSKKNDTDYIYKFGEPVQIMLKGSGTVGENLIPNGEFNVLETAVLDKPILKGVGENIVNNMFAD